MMFRQAIQALGGEEYRSKRIEVKVAMFLMVLGVVFGIVGVITELALGFV